MLFRSTVTRLPTVTVEELPGIASPTWSSMRDRPTKSWDAAAVAVTAANPRQRMLPRSIVFTRVDLGIFPPRFQLECRAAVRV